MIVFVLVFARILKCQKSISDLNFRSKVPLLLVISDFKKKDFFWRKIGFIRYFNTFKFLLDASRFLAKPFNVDYRKIIPQKLGT